MEINTKRVHMKKNNTSCEKKAKKLLTRNHFSVKIYNMYYTSQSAISSGSFSAILKEGGAPP